MRKKILSLFAVILFTIAYPLLFAFAHAAHESRSMAFYASDEAGFTNTAHTAKNSVVVNDTFIAVPKGARLEIRFVFDGDVGFGSTEKHSFLAIVYRKSDTIPPFNTKAKFQLDAFLKSVEESAPNAELVQSEGSVSKHKPETLLTIDGDPDIVEIHIICNKKCDGMNKMDNLRIRFV